MSAEDGGLVKVVVAIATAPFIFGFVTKWIADAVARSDSPSLLMIILRAQFGPVLNEGQSLQSYFRELAGFWFQVAIVLGLSLIAIYSIATWQNPKISDDVVFGALVYIVGPMLVITAALRSLVYLMRS